MENSIPRVSEIKKATHLWVAFGLNRETLATGKW
jgi:hypothetical protein